MSHQLDDNEPENEHLGGFWLFIFILGMALGAAFVLVSTHAGAACRA